MISPWLIHEQLVPRPFGAGCGHMNPGRVPRRTEVGDEDPMAVGRCVHREFPGVREIAVFASVGILAALSMTLWVLPPLLPTRPAHSKLQRRLADLAGGVLERMRRRRGLLALPPVVALALIGAAIPQLEFNDQASALINAEPDLLAEDEEVRALVSRMDAGRMVLVLMHKGQGLTPP